MNYRLTESTLCEFFAIVPIRLKLRNLIERPWRHQRFVSDRNSASNWFHHSAPVDITSLYINISLSIHVHQFEAITLWSKKVKCSDGSLSSTQIRYEWWYLILLNFDKKSNNFLIWFNWEKNVIKSNKCIFCNEFILYSDSSQ